MDTQDTEYLTVGEFRRWAGGVTDQLTDMNQAIGGLNERTMDKKAARNHSAGWSAGVSGFIVVVIEAVKAYYK